MTLTPKPASSYLFVVLVFLLAAALNPVVAWLQRQPDR
jgi:hypothetical protein